MRRIVEEFHTLEESMTRNAAAVGFSCNSSSVCVKKLNFWQHFNVHRHVKVWYVDSDDDISLSYYIHYSSFITAIESFYPLAMRRSGPIKR